MKTPIENGPDIPRNVTREWNGKIKSLKNCNVVKVRSSKFGLLKSTNVLNELCAGNVVTWGFCKTQAELKTKHLNYSLKFTGVSNFQNENKDTGQTEVNFSKLSGVLVDCQKCLFLLDTPDPVWKAGFMKDPAAVITRLFKNYEHTAGAADRGIRIWNSGDKRGAGGVWRRPNKYTVRFTISVRPIIIAPAMPFTLQVELNNLDPNNCPPDFFKMDNIPGFPEGNWDYAVIMERTKVDKSKTDAMLNVKKFFFVKILSETKVLMSTVTSVVSNLWVPYVLSKKISALLAQPANDTLMIRELMEIDSKHELKRQSTIIRS